MDEILNFGGKITRIGVIIHQQLDSGRAGLLDLLDCPVGIEIGPAERGFAGIAGFLQGHEQAAGPIHVQRGGQTVGRVKQNCAGHWR